jgi:hypothetical protein
MKVNDIELPKYSLAQELWNSISHGLGTVFTLIAGPFMIIKVAQNGGCSLDCGGFPVHPKFAPALHDQLLVPRLRSKPWQEGSPGS